MVLSLGLLYRWATMVPQVWSWRAGDLKHGNSLHRLLFPQFQSLFNHYKCEEASKTALAGCQPLKSPSQAVQGEYVDCRTVAWQDEDSFQASMTFDVRFSRAKLCTLQPCFWTGPDGHKLRQVGSWVDEIESRWFFSAVNSVWSKGIKQADTSTNDSNKQTQSHRDPRPSKTYRCFVT